MPPAQVLLRLPHIAALFAAVLFLLAVSTATGAGNATARERTLLEEMNRVRADHGLALLRLDPRLETAARSHSADMMRRGYFSHGSFARRVRSFGVRGRRLGENLAWGTGSYSSARALVGMWMGSPPHRANLLQPGFRRVGIGAVIGAFAGHGGATVVTADFAGR